MKFLFEIGDVLTKEKYIAEQSVARPRTDIIRIHPDFMAENKVVLDKEFIPLGTVKFCASYMHHMRIRPWIVPLDYPHQLMKYLGREVRYDFGSTAKPTDYVKPRITKQFTCDTRANVEETLSRDISEDMVWISEPINLVQEYRMYILNHKVVGYSRYDDNYEADIPVDLTLVYNMIADFSGVAPVSYTLDVGILSKTNETVLIEVNDMWATGLYEWGPMSGDMYLKCIEARWFEIMGVINS